VIRMALQPNSVSIGEANDRDKSALAEQAYHLTLGPKTITVAANAAPGLFFGVQTLLQLIRRREDRLWLPEGEIVDWPDLELRAIYWDDAHHLERLEVLKQAVRQAAFFKINGFAIKLEGHFQYKSAPVVVEPYALTPVELQELTDYGLRYHVQEYNRTGARLYSGLLLMATVALLAPSAVADLDLAQGEAVMRKLSVGLAILLIIAYVLGLSHALNIAFFTALAESGEAAPKLARMSSTTFDSQLDVASRVAQESPELYYEIQSLNDYGAESLEALSQAVERIRTAVVSQDHDAFVALMRQGRDYLEDRRSVAERRA